MTDLDLDTISDTDIAIVGVAARVPGANSADAFWANLVAGKESVLRLTTQELLDAGEDAQTIAGKNYIPVAAPLEQMEYFDADFFGFSPKEAAILDPQHRHFLECAWEALEDAGHPPEKFEGRVGVFAGCGMGSYFYFNLCTNPDLVDSVGMFLLRHTGNDKDFLPTRLSYLLNLQGPALGVQTACSTSLVAVHLACQSLLSRESDMALAGGVTIELPHRRGYVYQENEILSPDGHCRAFDAKAQGTVFGSGTGVVVLRRLRDAVADGDHIMAIIRGSAVNNDGSTKAGYLAPSVDGQAAAVAEALAIADVSARSIGYVECHGTGTYLGDPIEVAALSLAFRESTDESGFCRIGSVKTNIGHLDTAAGVVSLIKAAYIVKQGVIPPSINYESPNPSIEFATSPFVVNHQLTEWNSTEPRRAGVNSLGVGGTNAHVVVEQPPTLPSSALVNDWQLLLLSARNRAALDDASRRLADHLEQHPDQPLADVCYTLLEGRRAFTQRRVLAAQSREEAVQLLRSQDPRRVFTLTSKGDEPEVVFMFPGGGAQYVGMASGLYGKEAEFRRWVDRGLEYLGRHSDIDAASVLLPKGDVAREKLEQDLLKPGLQLPLLFIVEYALAQLLISKGIHPKALIGHSMGENTAACLAGVFTFEDALGLVLLRGRLLDKVLPGSMLSVALTEAQVRERLGTELDLACINGPELCVVSGPRAAIDAFREREAAQGVDIKPIPIDIAAHSRMLEPILGEFEAYLRSIQLSAPTLPFVSNRSGTWVTDAEATDPTYWVQHLRHTVHYHAGIGTVAEGSNRVLVEVGPGTVLGSLAKLHPKVAAQNVINTLRHPQDQTPDDAFLLLVLGRLWGTGRALTPHDLWPHQRRLRVRLPTYAFQRDRYFIEPGVGQTKTKAGVLKPRRLEDPNGWYFAPDWRREDLSRVPPQQTYTWLAFLDEDGLTAEVVARLREQGHMVISVRAGDVFQRCDDDTYLVPPEHGRDAYAALLRDLVSRGYLPERVIVGWCWAQQERFRPGSTFFHRNLELGFYSLLYLAQAIAQEEFLAPLHLIALTSGAFSTSGDSGHERVPYPEQAAVLGPARVIPREFPQLTCSVVDVSSRTALPVTGSAVAAVEQGIRLLRSKLAPQKEPPHIDRSVVDCLLTEILAEPGNRTVAVRGDVRLRLHYDRALVKAGQPLFAAQHCYLITGGFGGIGQCVARHLAQNYHANLVLLSRQPLPPQAEWEAWLDAHPGDAISQRIEVARELQQLGSQVLTLAADVADVQAVADAVADARSVFGEIHGVIHGAGEVNDAPIVGKREAEIEKSFAAKVHGTRVLWQALEDQPPELMVFFSSTSTAIAAPGQVDYVAANCYLNSFAEHLRGKGVRAVALNWGIWNQVGMAVAAASQLGLNVGVAPEKPAKHPWFRGMRRAKGGATLTLELSPEKHWVLSDHRTASGVAVMPGTGYVELIRAALGEVVGEREFEIQDLYFFTPLSVADNATKIARVQLTPSEHGYAVEVSTLLSDDETSGPWQTHAQAQTILRRSTDSPESSLLFDELERRFPREMRGREGRVIRSPQEAHLRFGERWRVLEQARFGHDEAWARLALPADVAEDVDGLGLHPGLLDLATGFAMSLIPGYDESNPRQLWVPVTYKSIRVRHRLPAHIASWVRRSQKGTSQAKGSDDFASFDVTISDREGLVLVEVKGLTIKRLSDPEFITASSAATAPSELPTSKRELSAQEQAFQHNLQNGLTPTEGMRALEQVLSSEVQSQLYVTSMDLNELVRQGDTLVVQRSSEMAKFSRPKLDSDYVEPRNDLERTLVEVWEDLLGVDKVGVRDSFFDLGGHSLIAVRLFSKINKLYAVDYPISVLFEAPTIEACAALIRTSTDYTGDAEPKSTSKPKAPPVRFRYLVGMHPSDSPHDTPFFLVAGMFGNVLNLRQIANLIGAERPFYGVQARGLYGEDKPHESFEEMAADYLSEVRQVQPHGPYLLGGFSGGGIVAYEMARQLLVEGESVSLLVMLDTPLPSDKPLSTAEKLAIHRQNLTRQGARYPVSWLKDKMRYHREMAEKARRLHEQKQGAAPSEQFHSQAIEAAFYSALEKYRLQPVAVDVTLFRPKLRPTHTFPSGEMINQDRRRIYTDNGWGPYVRNVAVYEMPGDHDNMVLEPNVRIMAANLRRCIDAATASSGSAANAEKPPPSDLSPSDVTASETTGVQEQCSA